MSERTIELTTAPFIKHLEDAFYVAGQLNKVRPKDAQIGLEVYPIHYFMGADFGNRITPGIVTADNLRSFSKEHKVDINRVHLPFHYDLPSAFTRFATSFVKEKGTWRDRWTAMKVSVATGTLQNQFALQLAREMEAEVNAHVYLVEEGAKQGKVEELKRGNNGVLVENDLDYPRKNIVDIRRARDPMRAVAAVEKYNLKGVILGLDHAYGYNIDPMNDFDEPIIFEALKRHLRSVHIAGKGRHQGGHGRIDLEDAKFWEFIRFLKMIDFEHDVSFCIDINQEDMAELGSLDKQLEYMGAVVEKLEKAA